MEAIGEVSKTGKRVNGLSRLLGSPILWNRAYLKIYPNQGALTPGVDGITIDGFSEDRVVHLIQLLKRGAYKPQPSKRVYIPKSNGKMRPLGISSSHDKLLQEVIRDLLERIYESTFSEYSHGFRQGRSCHTALDQIRREWHGVKWFIEFDLKSFFDMIDRKILLKLLEKKIDDQPFLRLIKQMLQAGTIEERTHFQTFSGTPQGSGVSPVLANVYLHELDQFIEVLQQDFNAGDKRRQNPEYTKYEYQSVKSKQQIVKLQKLDQTHLPEYSELIRKVKTMDRMKRTVPYGDPWDENFRRLKYCRYCDDFLIGIIGTRQEAVRIKEQIETFLREVLHLEISEEKTALRSAKEKVEFLGYHIQPHYGERVVKTKVAGRSTRMRSIRAQMSLYVPEGKVLKFCNEHRYGDMSKRTAHPRPYLTSLSDLEIIRTYNDELRGFANYYALACNVKRKLGKLMYLGQYSLFKTLAHKHKTFKTRIIAQLRRKGDFIYQYQCGNQKKQLKVFKLKDLKTKPCRWQEVDQVPNTLRYRTGTELLERMNANQCEFCGRKDGYFEVHHVRKLADIKDGKENWQRLMIARRRKTLVLCVECHDLLHRGKLPDWRQTIVTSMESVVR
ncbi:reverse transcriptase domain-containing protein [Deltaproteobacteria bacterium TL4]